MINNCIFEFFTYIFDAVIIDEAFESVELAWHEANQFCLNFSVPLFGGWSWGESFSSRYLLVQSQQWKHQKKICSKWTIKTQGRRHCSGVFIVNFEKISHIVLVFPLLTSNKYLTAELELSRYLEQTRP